VTAALVPLLRAGAWAATGIASFDYFTEEQIADQWRESDTFNSVGGDVNSQFEIVNKHLSKCAGAWNAHSPGFREEWRSWSAWWGDAGDRWTDASAGDVRRLRDYAVAINKWAVLVGGSLKQACPDVYKVYPYKELTDLRVDPSAGTVTEQQAAALQEASTAAQIAKKKQQEDDAGLEKWTKLLSGVGWVLAGGIALATVAFGYRIYKDVRS
jgi:hypothetical protein